MLPPVEITTTRFSKDEHLLKAKRNKAFALAIQPLNSTMCGWCVTILFYSALHFVQAYLVTRGMSSDIKHEERKRCIRDDASLRSIWPDYDDLAALAHKARYTMAQF